MEIVAERPDRKLREWSPETAEQVRSQVLEIIELADQGLLDIVRSRQVEQEVLDLLDEPAQLAPIDSVGKRYRTERPEAGRPDFLNTDGRSGFADSNP